MSFLPCNTMHTPGKTVTVKKAQPGIQLERMQTQCNTAQSRVPITLQAVLGFYRLLDFLLNSPPNLNSRS